MYSPIKAHFHGHKKSAAPLGSLALFRYRGHPQYFFVLTLGAATPKTLVEAVYPTTGIQDLLLAGKERVTL